MALAARAAMVDLVAKLEVLSKDHGCLLDLTAILDVSVCPTIDIFLPRPHTIQPVQDDYICVTPTEAKAAPVAARGYTAAAPPTTPALPSKASVPGGSSYVPSTWCPKPVVDFDLLALVGLDLLVEADLQVYLNLLDLIKADIDLDITLGKRGYSAPSAPAVPSVPATPQPPKTPKTPAQLGIDLDLDINIDLDLSVDLDLDIELGGRRVRKARKHFTPHCGKQIPEATPGCKRITASDPTDCLARCHAHAAQVSIDARATVGDIADVVDCTAISFDRGLTVNNCLVATVDLLGLVLVDAEVDTLIRL